MRLPKLGNIVRRTDIGHVGYGKVIWAACELCGKERWVTLLRGEPKRRRCQECKGKPDIDPEQIVQLYFKEKLSAPQVAEKLGVRAFVRTSTAED